MGVEQRPEQQGGTSNYLREVYTNPVFPVLTEAQLEQANLLAGLERVGILPSVEDEQLKEKREEALRYLSVGQALALRENARVLPEAVRDTFLDFLGEQSKSIERLTSVEIKMERAGWISELEEAGILPSVPSSSIASSPRKEEALGDVVQKRQEILSYLFVGMMLGTLRQMRHLGVDDYGYGN